MASLFLCMKQSCSPSLTFGVDNSNYVQPDSNKAGIHQVIEVKEAEGLWAIELNGVSFSEKRTLSKDEVIADLTLYQKTNESIAIFSSYLEGFYLQKELYEQFANFVATQYDYPIMWSE